MNRHVIAAVLIVVCGLAAGSCLADECSSAHAAARHMPLPNWAANPYPGACYVDWTADGMAESEELRSKCKHTNGFLSFEADGASGRVTCIFKPGDLGDDDAAPRAAAAAACGAGQRPCAGRSMIASNPVEPSFESASLPGRESATPIVAGAVDHPPLDEGRQRRAEAGVVTFNLTSTAAAGVFVRFFSQASPRVWPASDPPFVIGERNKALSYRLQCTVGEQICYGAFSRQDSSSWGVGRDNKTCKGCCLICGTSAQNRSHGWTLNE